MAAAVPSGVLVRAAYRGFLREVRALSRSGCTAEVFDIPTPDFARFGTGAHRVDVDTRALQAALFPGVDFGGCGMAAVASFDAMSLLRVVRHEFRRPLPRGSGDAAGRALQHLHTLNRLRAAAATRTVSVTRFAGQLPAALEVELCTMTVDLPPRPPSAPPPQEPSYTFMYRVRIRNVGQHSVHVRARTWTFTTAERGEIVVPKWEPGVVGQQPALYPQRDVFEYFSGTTLPTATGVMEGAFLVQHGLTNEMFEAAIRPTKLGAA